MNAVVLVICSLWAFASLEKTSYTALIPAGFGMALFACYPAMTKGRKWAYILGAMLTATILAALYVPLTSALKEPFNIGLFRIVAMMAASTVALVCIARFVLK